MTRKSMDSLDAVEIVMVFEEVFETELPVNDAETLGGPTDIVDWLKLRLSNQRPNKQAIELLFKKKVVAVNTSNYAGKLKRVRGPLGRKPHWKKAIVTLKEGEKIDLV